MKRLAVLALFVTTLAVAAPVPKVKPNNFGTAVETKGVTCEMLRTGELRVRVSKEAASESDAHLATRPLVTRTVEGDFELTVRITHTPPEDKELATAVGNGEPIASAGLALHRSDGKRGSLVILNRLSQGRDGWDSYFRMSALYETKDTQGVVGNLSSHRKFSNEPIYLRLTRRGDEFTATKSDDGKEWSPVFDETREVPGLGPVVIGPVAVHNTNARHDVTFDEYVLNPLKTGEKK